MNPTIPRRPFADYPFARRVRVGALAGVLGLTLPCLASVTVILLGGRYATSPRSPRETDWLLLAIAYPPLGAALGALAAAAAPWIRRTWLAALVLGAIGGMALIGVLDLASEPRGAAPYRLHGLILVPGAFIGAAGSVLARWRFRRGRADLSPTAPPAA